MSDGLDAAAVRTAHTWAVSYSEDGLRRVFAQRGVDVFLTTALTVFVLVGAVGSTAGRNPTLDRLGAIASCVAGALVFWRILRRALVVEGATLTVRSIWGNRRIPATDIRHFEFAKPYGAFVGNGVRIALTSGKQVRTGVFVATPAAINPGRDQVNELNEWLVDVARGGPRQCWFRPAPGSWRDRLAKPLARVGTFVLQIVWFAEVILVIAVVVAPRSMGTG